MTWLPQNIPVSTTAQSTTVLKRRRRKTRPLEGGGGGAVVSDIAGKLANDGGVANFQLEPRLRACCPNHHAMDREPSRFAAGPTERKSCVNLDHCMRWLPLR